MAHLYLEVNVPSLNHSSACQEAAGNLVTRNTLTMIPAQGMVGSCVKHHFEPLTSVHKQNLILCKCYDKCVACAAGRAVQPSLLSPCHVHLNPLSITSAKRFTTFQQIRLSRSCSSHLLNEHRSCLSFLWSETPQKGSDRAFWPYLRKFMGLICRQRELQRYCNTSSKFFGSVHSSLKASGLPWKWLG